MPFRGHVNELTLPAIAILVSVVLWALSILWQLSKIGRRPANHPPGPPTLPLIGNLHQIPREKRHLQFGKWAREYGPVYSLMLGAKVMIVLSSDLAMKELVDKRGLIYSSRPQAYIGQDILSGGLRVLFMPNHDVWKMARKMAHRLLNVSAARTYVPYQDLENKAMLVGFLESPGDFIDHLRRYAASLTTQMTFGFRTTSIHNPEFKEAFDIFDRSSELIGSRPCVCVDLIKQQKEVRFSDELAAYLSGSLLQAGSETTSSILVGFIQAMIIFPDVAKTAQQELDRVCGERMPDLNDVPNLPAVHNDSERHPNPRQFEPSRYMGDDQTSIDAANNPDAAQRDHFVFGAGRRKCQGMHIADRSLFLAISRLLWAFDFQRPVNRETGREIIPDMDDLAEGVMMLPKPFEAKISPRSASKAESIRQEWAQLESLLDEQAQWKTVPEGLIWKDEQDIE
ncbi:Fumitremorgin C synthase 3 [Colletotrichum chlorophyti]|uniref:Fumitremorgin C synthase 3 n=1 Tax=Colletotrichum chlorophyti TaxID=708187 RepID=A0A1Q8RCB4_9PEZI|nr:Fumitremorgin C synthase 3 [Colletotrichum chlorophyti]